LRYSSGDFGNTVSALEAVVPEKLVHRDVERTSAAARFSAERRHDVFVVDLPSKTISVSIGGLEPDQTTSRHRHTYETILYVLEGEGFTVVEDERIDWKAGDAVYIPVWAWHQHTNTSSERRARYVACENAPLLQNLGTALREEASPSTESAAAWRSRS
jgi:gentisate 1,2-dioxygenase